MQGNSKPQKPAKCTANSSQCAQVCSALPFPHPKVTVPELEVSSTTLGRWHRDFGSFVFLLFLCQFLVSFLKICRSRPAPCWVISTHAPPPASGTNRLPIFLLAPPPRKRPSYRGHHPDSSQPWMTIWIVPWTRTMSSLVKDVVRWVLPINWIRLARPDSNGFPCDRSSRRERLSNSVRCQFFVHARPNRRCDDHSR